MIAAIYSVRNRCDLLRVSDDGDRRGAVAELFYDISPGALPQGTDDGLTGNQYGMLVLIHTQDALISHFDAAKAGVDGHVFVDLL